jgi:hypothetical protein
MFTNLWTRWLSRSSPASAMRRRRPAAVTRRRFRPALERMEDRIAPALYIVNALTDSGAGSGITGDLRYCINQANNNGAVSSNAILFKPGLRGIITLAAALPAINNEMILDGPGTDAVFVNGNSQGSVFLVGSGESVSISGLTITGGNAGGVFNVGTLMLTACTLIGNTDLSAGGGIYNDGSLTITNSTLAYNQSFDGGAIVNDINGILTITNSTVAYNSGDGTGCGGIINKDTLTVTGSTFSGNVGAGNGGAIFNTGALRVSDSTFSGNGTSNGGGGGIYNFGGIVIVTSSTFSGNFAGTTGGGIAQRPGAGNTTIDDTIVAGNTAPVGPKAASPDFAGPVTSLGYNLIGDGTGSAGFTGPGDQVGTTANSVNPELGPLADNGGPTWTMALLSGSPAINAGNLNSAGMPEFDQRGPGFPRIVGGRIDIGAYESLYQPTPSQLAFTVVPSMVTAGADFNFQVDVEDTHGNLVISDSSLLSVTGGALTVQVVGGIASFYGMSVPTAGTYTLEISDPADGMAPIATSLTVNPSSPAIFSVYSGSGQSTTVGTAFANLVVELTDAHGGRPGERRQRRVHGPGKRRLGLLQEPGDRAVQRPGHRQRWHVHRQSHPGHIHRDGQRQRRCHAGLVQPDQYRGAGRRPRIGRQSPEDHGERRLRHATTGACHRRAGQAGPRHHGNIRAARRQCQRYFRWVGRSTNERPGRCHGAEAERRPHLGLLHRLGVGPWYRHAGEIHPDQHRRCRREHSGEHRQRPKRRGRSEVRHGPASAGHGPVRQPGGGSGGDVHRRAQLHGRSRRPVREEHDGNGDHRRTRSCDGTCGAEAQRRQGHVHRDRRVRGRSDAGGLHAERFVMGRPTEFY